MQLFAMSADLAAGVTILLERDHPLLVHPPSARALDALRIGYPVPTCRCGRLSIRLATKPRWQAEHAAQFIEDLWQAMGTSETILVWHLKHRLEEGNCSFDQYSRYLFLAGARWHSIYGVLRGSESALMDRRPHLLVYLDGLELLSFPPRRKRRFRLDAEQPAGEHAAEPVSA